MRASVRLRAPHVIVDTGRGPGKMCCGRERGRERSRGLHATALQIATHTTTPSLTIPSVLCLSQDTNNCSLSLSLSLCFTSLLVLFCCSSGRTSARYTYMFIILCFPSYSDRSHASFIARFSLQVVSYMLISVRCWAGN